VAPSAGLAPRGIRGGPTEPELIKPDVFKQLSISSNNNNNDDDDDDDDNDDDNNNNNNISSNNDV
jgi:hypothetical protein